MRRAIIAACVLTLLACGGDGSNQSLEPISRVGTYSLVTVSGRPLPYAFPLAPGYELIEETITLNADNTFNGRDVQRLTQGGQVQTGEVLSTGTYTVNGLQLTQHHSTGHVIVSSFTGDDEITSLAFGETWVLRR